MYPRSNYAMTDADLQAILDACKPTPVMFLSGGQSMFKSPQENANAAWAALGEKMGFDHMTVRPIAGEGPRFFSAVPRENEEQRTKRLVREEKEKARAEIDRLETVITEAQQQLFALRFYHGITKE